MAHRIFEYGTGKTCLSIEPAACILSKASQMCSYGPWPGLSTVLLFKEHFSLSFFFSSSYVLAIYFAIFKVILHKL